MELQKEIEQLKQDLLDVVSFTQNIDDTVKTFLPYFQSVNQSLDAIRQRLDAISEKQELLKYSDILHINTGEYGNIGDFLLNAAVKKALLHFSSGSLLFADRNVSHSFGYEEARLANRHKAIVVGGGGLLFCHDGDQPHSWQWNLAPEAIETLSVPVFLFAVGYNQFRGQGDLGEDFRHEINLLAEKCGFIGLRNHGSINAMKKYLTLEHQEKVVFQPCPTTILSRLFPVNSKRQNFIALNMAFDRPLLRFGSQERMNRILIETLQVIAALSNQYPIKYYAHVKADDMFCKLLENNHINFEYVPLYESRNIEQLMEYYATPALVIGMRGHAQMIPFGCGTPILSIVSHDKMQFFLDDIHHPEWGVDVTDDAYGEKLLTAAQYILNHQKETQAEIQKEQAQLYNITQENIRTMFNILQSDPI